MQRLFRTLVKLLVIAPVVGFYNLGVPTAATAQDFYMGQIVMFGSNFCPRNFAEANGQILNIAQNQALFSLFGTTFGGDGKTTFGLPNLSGRAPSAPPAPSANLKVCIAISGLFPPRN